MANPSARAGLTASGKFAPDPSPKLNGNPKALPPTVNPMALPPPLTQEQINYYKTEAKAGPTIVMSPSIRNATAAGRSGSPAPMRPPPQPPSNPSTPPPPSPPQNGKASPAAVPPAPLSPSTKSRPQSAMPAVIVAPTPKPEPKPAAPIPATPSPPPDAKPVILFKMPKKPAPTAVVTPQPVAPVPSPPTPANSKMRLSELPAPQPPRATGERPYSIAPVDAYESDKISPRRNNTMSTDGNRMMSRADVEQAQKRLLEAKEVTNQELRLLVAEVATFQDFTRSIVLQELNQAAHRFMDTPARQLLQGGCRQAAQDILAMLRKRKESGLTLTKVESHSTTKLLLVINKFDRVLNAFNGIREAEAEPVPQRTAPSQTLPSAPTAPTPTKAGTTRQLHAAIPPPQATPPQVMEEIVICRICERKIPASERAKHTDTCTFRTQADPRIAYCNDSMTKCISMVANIFRSATSQQSAAPANNGQKLTLKVCWVSDSTGDITGTKMMSPDSTEPVRSVLHKILSSPGMPTDGSTMHLNEWGLYVPRVGVWLDERLSIGTYDLRDKESIYFKKRPRDSARPKSMAGSRLSTMGGAGATAVSSIANQEFIETVKSLVVTAIGISMKMDKPDDEITKVFRFFQQVRTQNVLYKTRCAKEDREILDRMKEKMDIITKLVELKKSSRRKSIYEPPTGKYSIADFEIVKPISRGAFGQVFLARKKATGDIFAIKAIKKSEAVGKNQASKNHLAIERNILTFANNTCVVKLYYTFQSKNYLYMVMEYLPGGDLFSLLRNMNTFEEEWARKYCAEIVLALEYLHNNGIIHRDVKPDNILISRTGHIKLTDFGLSEMAVKENLDSTMGAFMEPVEEEEKETAKGSPEYLAPEILNGLTSGFTVDWWALGVMLYEFLVGITPFYADTIDEVFENVMAGDVSWPEAPDQPISDEAVDLVMQLLNPDPSKRLGAHGAAEIKAHPFFASIDWNALLQEPGPMVPKVDDTFSTEYFEARNDLYKVDYVIDIDEETREEVKDQRMRRWTGVNFHNLTALTLGQS